MTTTTTSRSTSSPDTDSPATSSPATRTHYYQPPRLSPALDAWLDRADRWHIEYGGFLSNHLTHNLVVLAAADVPEEMARWWEDLYSGRLATPPARSAGDLEPRRAVDPHRAITDANWREHIERDRHAFPEFREFFAAKLRAAGHRATLHDHLPPLLPGVAGAALHPLIHTGWAIEAGHDGMLAEGLAYLATAHQPLGTGPAHQPPRRLWSPDGRGLLDASATFLDTARRLDLSGIVDAASHRPEYAALQRGRFQHRMITFDDPSLPMAAALNGVGPLGLPALDQPLRPALEEAVALMAAALPASGNEFFVLHGLTALHATLCILPLLEPTAQRDALTHWWRATMAALVAQDLPGVDQTLATLGTWRAEQDAGHAAHQADDAELRWWHETLRSTLPSHDEHLAKAVFALGRWVEWGMFRAPTVRLFEAAAQTLATPHPSGELHRNLRTARSY